MFAGQAGAHDFWIEPDNLRPATGTEVSIRLREGVSFKGNTLPYITDWFEDFTVTTSAGREPVVSILGDDPAARLVAVSGDALIGYQSRPNYVELDAEKFNSYLEHEGIEFIRAQRIAAGTDNDPAPEYFIRCAKALLQSAAAPGDLHDTRLGYALEIMLLDNPADLAPGATLHVELLKDGEPAPGLLIQAFTRAAPDAIQKIRTDADGRASVTIDASGTWLVKAVNIQPLEELGDGLWLSHWASYVFAVPEAAQR